MEAKEVTPKALRGRRKQILQTVLLILLSFSLTVGGLPVAQASSEVPPYDWADLSAGNTHTLAVTNDGELWAWGDNRYYQLGTGDTISHTEPVHIMSNIVMAAAGAFHSIALTKTGELYVWGWNSRGQLGLGTTAAQTTPTRLLFE